MSLQGQIEAMALKLATAEGLSGEAARHLSGMVGIVWDAWMQGHTAYPIASLGPESQSLLGDEAVQSLLMPKAQGSVKFPIWREFEHLFLVRNAVAEQSLAQVIRQRQLANEVCLSKDSLAVIQSASLSEEQKRAVQGVLGASLTIISGGPGTGKTRALAVAIDALLHNKPSASILALAPTGKAASRLSDALLSQDVKGLGLTVQTVQLALSRERESLAAADLVIVDEASMLDLELARDLLRALGQETRLVFAGDVDQLASVQPGAVFAQLAQSLGAFRLTQNFRAQGQERLIRLCESVRQADCESFFGVLGKARSLSDINLRESDVFWIEQDDDELEYLQSLQTFALAWQAQVDMQDHAFAKILVGANEGPFGGISLNRFIAKNLGGSEFGAEVFFPGAVVMNRKNDWSLGLSNGDIGVCVVNAASKELEVRFAHTTIPVAQIRLAELAFAITVHKAQGSEYERVLFFCPQAQSPLATRELLYTAVSRAKSQLVLVASRSALEACLSRKTLRYSALAQRLQG